MLSAPMLPLAPSCQDLAAAGAADCGGSVRDGRVRRDRPRPRPAL